MVKAKKKTDDQSSRHIAPSLNDSGQESVSTSHSPIELPLDLIDEDPNQPRTVFDPQLLQELADTIRDRGVKNPISVHLNTEKPGRYIINDGARRYRASKMAGKKSIPAFIDPDFTKIDQIIVNAHMKWKRACHIRGWSRILGIDAEQYSVLFSGIRRSHLHKTQFHCAAQ